VPWSFPATLELFDPAGRPVETLFAGQLTRGEWVFAPRMDRRGVFIAVLRYKAGMKKTVLLR